MQEFIKIFPYIFGAAISPVLLVTILYVLSKPVEPIKKALIFLMGSAVTISIITYTVFYSTNIRPNPAPNKDLIPHLTIGSLLLLLAFDIYKKGPAKNEHKRNKKSSLLSFFGLGVLLMVTNFTTLAMIFEVALDLRQYGVTGTSKDLYLVTTILFALIPILLPLIILVLAGKNSQKILDRLSVFMKSYAHIVTAIFFAILGLFSLAKPFMS